MLPEAVKRVRTASRAALKIYRPAPLACEVTFFQAMGRIDLFPPEPRPVWRGLVGRLEIEKIPGEHLSLVLTNARVLAAALERRLRTALLTA